MSTSSDFNWQQDSQDFLMSALSKVTQLVEKYLDPSAGEKTAQFDDSDNYLSDLETERHSSGITPEELMDLTAPLKSHQRPNALSNLVSQLNLSDTEIFVLLVSVAVEIVPTFSRLCSSYRGSSNQQYPTFELIASVFARFDTSVMSETSSLTFWQLLRRENSSDLFSTQSPVLIDPPILSYLLGSRYYNQDICRGLNKYISASKIKSYLTPEPSFDAIGQISSTFQRAIDEEYSTCVQLTGTDVEGKQSLVYSVAAQLGSGVFKLSYFNIPLAEKRIQSLSIELLRWIKLDRVLLHIEADRLENGDLDRFSAIRKLIKSFEFPLIISTSNPVDWGEKNTYNLEVSLTEDTDQITLWHKYLGIQLTPEIAQQLPKLVSQFNLSASEIQAVSSKLLICDPAKNYSAFDILWDNCRILARQKIDPGLAYQIKSNVSWDNLILPPHAIEQLKSIVFQIEQQALVNTRLSMGRNRASGVTALFSGVWGTGKTTAAEAIANELKLDLYKIELPTAIRNCPSETEKHLRRIFDAAEAGGVILLFEEAGTLFEGCTKVGDIQDRDGEAEINYLLQKMKSYRGLAILSTNTRDAVDLAFQRQLQFLVDFPEPDLIAREKIWQKIYPQPETTWGLDYRMLASLNLTGGDIRSIALNAAFKAAKDDEPVQMRHILSAAREEALKLDWDTKQLEMIETLTQKK